MSEVYWIFVLCVSNLWILGTCSSEVLENCPLRNGLSFTCQGSSEYVEYGLTIEDKGKCTTCNEGDQCLDYGSAKVVIKQDDENCQLIHWTTTELTELKDCVNLIGHWYGGGGQFDQPWPLETNPRVEIEFVTADMLADEKEYGHVVERYWVSSNGTAVRVLENVPLFFSMPDNDGDGRADQMCFSSRYELPFVAQDANSSLNLTYYMCFDEDVRKVYNRTFSKFFSYPEDIVEERMLTHPIWSTWAEYFSEVNESRVVDLAKKIQEEGFENSQIEIDDRWETCYGDARFDPSRFPDPKKMVDLLHSMGYRVTVWVTPFINNDCESFAIADEAKYLVKDENGTTQLTSWWNGNETGIVDFTNPDAVNWWTGRLNRLIEETGIDGYKFDAGETNWLPEIYTLNLKKTEWPNGYTTAYINTVSSFGNISEIRTGVGNQHNPVFVRMLDKSSVWSEENVLRSLIPSLFHSGFLGYPFVLPDMIGGNAYEGKPSSELFVRWAQANTFMPAIQFSLVPWDYDTEEINATEITRNVAKLHADFIDTFLDLARRAVQGEGPMIQIQIQKILFRDIITEFLLGDDILVTPVVYEGATTLDVIFPPGRWIQSDTGEVYEGFSKETISNITIESNIYFRRA